MKKKRTESILDALLYANTGVLGLWDRWRTLASLEPVDRRRVKYIAQLLRQKRPRSQDILKAAYLLRTVGFIDDAVRLLKKFREYDEAADFLIVAGRGHEAAKIYESRRQWEKAARCYTRLEMRTDAARCFEAGAKPEQAATLYESSRRFADAARCYEASGVTSAAAICYANAGNFQASASMFELWFEQEPEEFQAMPLGYLDALVLSMSRGRMIEHFLTFLEMRGGIPDLVRELLKSGKDNEALDVYKRYREDIVDDLCKWAETDIKDGYRALRLFESAGDKKAGRYLNTHFSVADVTRQKLMGNETKTSQRAPGNAMPYDPRTEAIFANAVFFRNLDRKYQEALWQGGKVSRHLRNKIIVEFGSRPTGVITVLTGSLQLYRRTGQQSQLIGTFHKGQTIGESWLVYEMASEVRAVAGSDCTIHVADRLGEQASGLNQAVSAQLARHLMERVKPGALNKAS